MDRYTYRGKSVSTKGSKWVYGYVAYMFGCYGILDQEDMGLFTPAHKETVGQFTGLHDKNGKAIFEGDIIYDSEWECEGAVVWSNQHLAWMLRREDGEEEFLQEFITGEKTMKACSSVFIGTIHDTLKGE